MVKSRFDVLCSTEKLGKSELSFTVTNSECINNVAVNLPPKLSVHEKLMTSEYIVKH